MRHVTGTCKVERLMGKLDADVKKSIRNIQDYPRKGIPFKDLTTLWMDGKLARRVTASLLKKWGKVRLDKIVGIEARGFIVGAPLADRLGIGFVPARKVGRLPASKISVSYELEYGRQGLEMHKDSITKGDRVLVVDDLLATGGTAKAAATLVEKLGGKVVGCAFVTELCALNGRRKLSGYEVYTVSKYD